MLPVILIARGSTPEERKRSIDTIRRWIHLHDPAGIDADTVQSMYEWTEKHAATAALKQDQESFLYVVAGEDTARDRQGPDDPAAAALRRAQTEDNSNVIVDSLAGLPVEDVMSVTDTGAHVYDCSHGVTVYPTASDDEHPVATRRAIEVLTGTAEHADALLAGIEWGGGRPPLGCTSEDGRLAPGDDYDRVCRTLQRVRDGDTSKTRAADRLGCARKTIDAALDRPNLYRLD